MEYANGSKGLLIYDTAMGNHYGLMAQLALWTRKLAK